MVNLLVQQVGDPHLLCKVPQAPLVLTLKHLWVWPPNKINFVEIIGYINLEKILKHWLSLIAYVPARTWMFQDCCVSTTSIISIASLVCCQKNIDCILNYSITSVTVLPDSFFKFTFLKYNFHSKIKK